jgi:hypothetical protein
MRHTIVFAALTGCVLAAGCASDGKDRPAPVGADTVKLPGVDSAKTPSAPTSATTRAASPALPPAPSRGTGPVSATPAFVSRSPNDSALRAGRVVRALYVNRWAAQSPGKMRHLIAIADTTEINGFVIDMKDEFGLNYRTTNKEWARNAGNAGTVPRLEALLDTLKAHNILPIARLVVFKDSVTAGVHPDWTIRKEDGSVWRDKQGLAWVNPYEHALWDYNIGIAEELAHMGFGEIQFDYIRFPEPYKSLPTQVFPNSNGVTKPDNLAAYLKEAQKRLNAAGVRSTADIFGLVTTVRGALEIGQWWEKISPVTDVVLPMVYPSHYPRGAFGIDRPNAEPYKVLKFALDAARERDDKLGIETAEHVRPWIQAFTLGPPPYGPEEIRQQKQAIYDAGYDGWVLWSPGSKYDSFVPAFEKELVSRKKK